jgi:peptidyl-prolyl cis-trans isomerase C
MLVAILFLIIGLPSRINAPQQEGKISLMDKQWLDYANILLAKGLKRQAADTIEKYINKAPLDKKELARLCYRLGGIYMDLYEYEKALKYFYRAEFLDKEADFAEEMNQKIVQALENLGMSAQARYELNSRTSLRQQQKPAGNVVARIGKQQITQTDISQALNRLPEWMRQQFKEPQKRLEFIRQYVATEVLYRKARRLGVDKDPQLRRSLEAMKKQLVVQKLVDKEVKQRLKIEPADVQLYYKANKDKYTQPQRIKVRYISFTEEAQKDTVLKGLKAGQGDIKEAWISKGQTYITGIGQAQEIVDKLFLKDKGAYSKPLKIKDRFYIFFVEDKQPRRIKSFDEVKSEVENEYRLKRQQEITDSILKEALEEQEVEILYEPPKEDKGSTDETNK